MIILVGDVEYFNSLQFSIFSKIKKVSILIFLIRKHIYFLNEVIKIKWEMFI